MASLKKLSQLDLTKGTPWQVLLIFCIPIILGNFVSQIYSIVDGIFVGKVIGSTAFAAIGLCGNITYIATAIGAGIPAGTSGYTAQLYGARDYDKVRQSYATTILFCVIGGILITALMIGLTNPLLWAAALTPGTEVYDLAATYIMIIFAGLIAVFFYNMYLNFLRAIGDSKVPFFLLCIYAGCNILFDYLLIVVAKWGVVGAGLAFDLAVSAAAIAGAVWTYLKYPRLHLRRSDFRFDKPFWKEHLRMGLPMAFLFAFIGISCLIMQGAIDGFGSDAINGYSAASKVENFLCVFIGSFGSAMEAYCGQNYGAKQYERVKKGVLQGFVIILVDAVLKILISFLVKDAACDIFLSSPNDATREYCRIYLYWDMATYFFLGLIYLCRNALLGVGKVFPPLFSGIAEFTGRLLCALALVPTLGAVIALGAPGVAWILAGTLLFVWACISILFNKKYKINEPRVVPVPTGEKQA